MNDKTLHEITNELHQVIGYAGLLRNDPQKYEAYSNLIEQSAYRIDALARDLCQTKAEAASHTPSKQKTVMIRNALQGKQILLVDDLVENREILQQIFSTLECNVESAMSGAEALDLFERYKPDIVCMDIIMPGMKGDEATRLLKEAGCSARFIAVSALKEHPEKDLSIFDAWLPKPFTIDQILDTLASLDLCTVEHHDIAASSGSVTLDDLSEDEKEQIINSLQKGALSELEAMTAELPESKSKTWLDEQLSHMRFETIRSTILSP